MTYGIEAFEAYQKGDFDTMVADIAVASASLASNVLYDVYAFRALRAARAAVMAGDAAAIAEGLDVVPHLGVKLLGLAVVLSVG